MSDYAAPYLSKILIYPIKSLDGLEVPHTTMLASGALKCDRQFAIVDSSGDFVNGKRYPQVHMLRSKFDLEQQIVWLKVQGSEREEQFDLSSDRPLIETWLSDYFKFPVKLIENLQTGFPDDLNSPGPTVISTATLETVSSWFPELDIPQIRLRFRANLEISGVPAFWEDQLFAAAGDRVPFQIGAVQFSGINPCQRCIVPTRHPLTGEVYPKFQSIFTTQRQKTLPDSVNTYHFNHFYRLSVNTQVANNQAEQILQIGDAVNFPCFQTI